MQSKNTGKVQKIEVPAASLLANGKQVEGYFADCFACNVVIEKAGLTDFERYIEIFFSTWVFSLELRLLALARVAKKPHGDVIPLAKGQSEKMASWKVLQRTGNELLLGVENSPIVTYLAIDAWAPNSEGQPQARLYFGSGVFPTSVSKDGKGRMSPFLSVLMPLHDVYSRILLKAAMRKWNKEI